jgi:integrase
MKRYIEYMQSNNPVDKHPDLARLRILQEFFARKSVRYPSDISPDLMDEFRTSVLAGRKPKTVKNYIALLKTALNKAVEWNIIDHNPIAKVKAPKIVKTFNLFTKKEIDRLISEADEPLKTGIIILVNTGMRRGELFHLRWRDVDLKAGSIRVWPYDGFSPKGKRPRKIPIPQGLKEVLRKLSRKKSPDDFVFRPFQSEHRLYKRFAALVKELGMKGTLHDLRHTYASHLAMAGVPIPVIKELLGHSDIATTMIYSHLSPEVHKAAVEKLPF